MQLRHEHVDVMGWKVRVPVLENKVALKARDVLRWDKKDVSDQKKASSGPPKKKARKG